MSAEPGAGRRMRSRGRRPRRGRGGAAATATATVENAGDDEERGEEAEHDQAELVGELAQHALEGAATEIAGSDEYRGPQESGDEIENEKALPGDAADADGEGREIAHAIDEAEAQDEPRIVALDPAQRRVDPRAPHRPTRQQPQAEIAADPEIALVAGKASEPGGKQQQRRVQETLCRGEAGDENEGLTLNES